MRALAHPVPQPEQPRALVDRLAGGIVEGATEQLDAAQPGLRAVHPREERVAAARDEHQVGRLRRRHLGQPAGEQVAMEVVDGHDGDRARRGERLGGLQAAEQRADEPWPLGDGDLIDGVGLHPGRAQGIRHHRTDRLDVLARGELGHHAAVRIVHALRRDRVAQHALAVEHGRARVVAGGLDGQGERHPAASFRSVGCAGIAGEWFQRRASARSGSGTSSKWPSRVPGVRHITSASSLLSG